jgi:hypothetical protein
MKIDDQLESVLASPLYSVLKVRQLALNVWLTRANFKGPVPDWQSHMVQSAVCRHESIMMYMLAEPSTYPAAAIFAKSFCVIQVFQWFCSTFVAVARS